MSWYLREHGYIETGRGLIPVDQAPPHLRDCDGRMDPCHLLRRWHLKDNFPLGVLEIVDTGEWLHGREITAEIEWGGKQLVGLERDGEYLRVRVVTLQELIDDPRIIVEGCRHHHGLLDVRKKLRLLPDDEAVLRARPVAAKLGMLTKLDREYRPRRMAVAA